MTQTTVTSLGNAGIRVEHGGRCILIDPFFRGFEGLVASPWADSKGIARSDMILITHDHWDHFNPSEVAAAVGRTGAVVLGPAPVAAKLKGKVPAASLVEVEPPGNRADGKYQGLRLEAAGIAVTAFRTSHSRGHNSYLVELPGFRFFHDGDNEKTQHFDTAGLKNLDALMLCPWQGSGWVEFIEVVRPKNWFLIHMTDEELDQQERGEFLRDLCDRVPMEPVSLRPGQSWSGG